MPKVAGNIKNPNKRKILIICWVILLVSLLVYKEATNGIAEETIPVAKETATIINLLA